MLEELLLAELAAACEGRGHGGHGGAEEFAAAQTGFSAPRWEHGLRVLHRAPPFDSLMFSGRVGGGRGFNGAKWGAWGLWQLTQSRYCFWPLQLPVRLPWMPTRQSRSLSPWHWPQSR